MPTAMKAHSTTRAATYPRARPSFYRSEDRKQRQRGADVGDDQKQLAQRAELNARVSAGADDVLRVVEHRVVEDVPGDGGDERDEEQHTRDEREPPRRGSRRSAE
jgi:hypothetical protein